MCATNIQAGTSACALLADNAFGRARTETHDTATPIMDACCSSRVHYYAGSISETQTHACGLQQVHPSLLELLKMLEQPTEEEPACLDAV